jgi:pimeloyl-ACP methyl ester carboxylesterase
LIAAAFPRFAARMTKDVLFIHGMFMNPKSWTGWVEFFSAKGYRCHTLAWPGHEGEPAALRASPPEILRTLKLHDVVQAHREFVDKLSEKPLLIGHSVGGLITQILVNEGRAAAACALDSAPPQHIFVLSWSLLKSNLPVVNPFAGDAPFQFSVDQFHYAFCNTMSLEDTQAVFDAYVVPESRGVARRVAGEDAHIDFAKPHAPLLLIGGEEDNIVPWKINKKTFEAYEDPSSVREFKLLPGRSHFLCGQPGWEETAGIVHEWLARY